MEGLLNGRGDLDDNIRMLNSIGAKFIGRSLSPTWGKTIVELSSRMLSTVIESVLKFIFVLLNLSRSGKIRYSSLAGA